VLDADFMSIVGVDWLRVLVAEPGAVGRELAGAPGRAAASPLVPSTRGGAPASDAPRRISGSNSSSDEGCESVGNGAESGGAEGDADAEPGASDPRSSSMPCASNSSSASVGPFEPPVMAGVAAGLACDARPV
jgi:hypothetical protein